MQGDYIFTALYNYTVYTVYGYCYLVAIKGRLNSYQVFSPIRTLDLIVVR